MNSPEALALVVILTMAGVAWWAYKSKNAEAMVRHVWTAFAFLFVLPTILYYLAWWLIGRRPF